MNVTSSLDHSSLSSFFSSILFSETTNLTFEGHVAIEILLISAPLICIWPGFDLCVRARRKHVPSGGGDSTQTPCGENMGGTRGLGLPREKDFPGNALDVYHKSIHCQIQKGNANRIFFILSIGKLEVTNLK